MDQQLPIDFGILDTISRQMMDGHIHYGLGSKASFKTPVSAIKKIDCSGFVRYLIYQATGGKIHMPDGSYIQHAWCKTQGFPTQDYRSTASFTDSSLRIAFINPRPKHVGHVWLVLNGETIESHGGKGPDRRPWDTKVLLDHVSDCYALTKIDLPVRCEVASWFA